MSTIAPPEAGNPDPFNRADPTESKVDREKRLAAALARISAEAEARFAEKPKSQSEIVNEMFPPETKPCEWTVRADYPLPSQLEIIQAGERGAVQTAVGSFSRESGLIQPESAAARAERARIERSRYTGTGSADDPNWRTGLKPPEESYVAL
jgi:hypothetical protein